ncbi:MAG: hypothetical protein U1E19_10105 [Rhodoblastus sp.]
MAMLANGAGLIKRTAASRSCARNISAIPRASPARRLSRSHRQGRLPEDLQWNAASLGGPKCHLVHYPLRGGEQYNVVVTFHSPREPEEWGVTDGSKEEVRKLLQGDACKARQLIDLPKSW